ncbi:Gfo/Idh/MocA family oxidoreductase [Jeotgalibacillus sp. ET6]|uniref:Gfo/Idh/MocA family protein n=1 Tax=Jeotgalibacillus sp. ET6 TaxID=3037260 RepID=UPI0024184D2C|nr:Gfo/Idh/MocA family oxidoreductase [Jeotgalibacillus sp. ET6]MDG5471311.1 Gfo/Idh/MocA family oxidoreductase [Jeotgalibacillus sp. ET6]
MNLNWGIIGTAKIARNSVIPAIQASQKGTAYAIASRNLESAQEVANDLCIPKAYGSYEDLLADPVIDAVYVPLPNHLHKEWSIKAMKAGKHVLCEKPIALNAKEAKVMKEHSEYNEVMLAEALMYLYHPRYQMIKKIIQSGEIGDIRSIHGSFTGNHAKDYENIRYQKDWGGGALYDVAVYPISAARLILEDEPRAVTVHAFFSELHDNVDMMASGIAEFDNGIGLTFDCGMWAASRNHLEILGTKGRIEVPSAFKAYQNEQDHILIVKDEKIKEVVVPYLNQYALLVDTMAESIHSGIPLYYPFTESIQNMKVIDACIQSANQTKRVEIN